jgi:hypothetical protein
MQWCYSSGLHLTQNKIISTLKNDIAELTLSEHLVPELGSGKDKSENASYVTDSSVHLQQRTVDLCCP